MVSVWSSKRSSSFSTTVESWRRRAPPKKKSGGEEEGGGGGYGVDKEVEAEGGMVWYGGYYQPKEKERDR